MVDFYFKTKFNTKYCKQLVVNQQKYQIFVILL